MIDGIGIDSDEGGFVLELDGDFSDEIAVYEQSDGCTMRIRLTQDCALKLYQAVIDQIAPWALEGARELAAYRRATPEERDAVLHPNEQQTEAIDPDPWPYRWTQ